MPLVKVMVEGIFLAAGRERISILKTEPLYHLLRPQLADENQIEPLLFQHEKQLLRFFSRPDLCKPAGRHFAKDSPTHMPCPQGFKILQGFVLQVCAVGVAIGHNRKQRHIHPDEGRITVPHRADPDHFAIGFAGGGFHQSPAWRVFDNLQFDPNARIGFLQKTDRHRGQTGSLKPGQHNSLACGSGSSQQEPGQQADEPLRAHSVPRSVSSAVQPA